MAAVDLHLKICEIPDASFIDTKLPATYVAPATHLLGHPTIVGLDVVGVFVGDSVGLSVGLRVGLSVEHAPSNLMLLMWINWLPPN